MPIIKKFEDFDFSQTLPITSKNVLTNYYHCDACNALWKEFNKESDCCKFCNNGDEVEELSEDEWYESLSSRLDDDEKDKLDEIRMGDQDHFLDLSEDEDLYNEN